jgi:hypothetical protein
MSVRQKSTGQDSALCGAIFAYKKVWGWVEVRVYLVDVVHLLLEDDSLLGQVTQALTRLLHHTPTD